MARLEAVLGKGEVVKNRWKVEERIGGGGFGQVYQGRDLWAQEEVAIKVESANNHGKRHVLRMEVVVLRKLQGRIHAPKLIGYGVTPRYNFIVMEYLSRNLAELRRESPSQRFSTGTTFRLAIQALEAISDLHTTGFVHRDIKPSNFTMGLRLETMRTVYLIDFGLARQFLNERGQLKPPREHVGFRGTLRYASLNSHLGKDIGRQDDLWSLFYMIVEIGKGLLPWSEKKERKEVFGDKRRTTLEEICIELPEQTVELGRVLTQLTYYDTPDYRGMEGLLGEVVKESGEGPLDWEVEFKTVEEEDNKKGNTEVKRMSSGGFFNTNAEADGEATAENTAMQISD